MAELLLSPFFDALFSSLASPLMEKGRMICHVCGDIDALSKRLSRIRDLLADAEARQITERSVKSWLAELKDVAYDADDVLDEIAYEALRREASNNGRRSQVRSFFPSSCSCFGLKQVPFKLDIAKKIKDINVRTAKIHEDRNNLGLTLAVGVGKKTSEPIQQRPFTTSILPQSESEITGRDEDREAIIKLLLLDDTRGGKEISVISIVGMGGLGKTTLAQLVFNHQNVKNYFEIRAWVCVSEDFDVSRLTKEIIESASTETIDSSLAFDRKQRKLQEILAGNRFLIVLDDVWNEDQGAWERLAAPFRVGARGSKIIVTTRVDAVSKAMNTDYLYSLECLGDEDCLSLFLRHAFPSENPDAINQELKKIGMELVQRRCDGLPLAAKTLGGLLSSRRDLNFWQSILNSQLWSSRGDESEVMKALRVSYHHLPPHFKQCFAFCSIFPKDHRFEKDILVHSWMAQGFIQPIPGTTFSTLEEEIGCEYFDFLLSRSFFQVDISPWSDNRIYYKMHDCIHDLAMSVSSDECFRIEHGKPTPSPIKGHRHSSFIPDKNTKTEDFGHLYKCKGLRTFILNFHWEIGVDILNRVICDLNMNLRCLRVLVLKDFDLIELPDSISNLKHLRYLDLSNTRLTQLPESVRSLHNLQTLNLSGCFKLCQLPKETRKLVNLRHLNLSRCHSLQSMPESLSHNLQTLNLSGCESLQSMPKSLSDNLQTLNLSGCHSLQSMPESLSYNLQTLNLSGCSKLGQLPKETRKLVNLRHLYLDGCRSLESMPPEMGRLSRLQMLPTFVVGRKKGCGIGELKGLTALKGAIRIEKLNNVLSNVKEAEEANLKDKPNIEKLELEWDDANSNEEDEACMNMQQQVLEALQPPKNIKTLSIYRYGGKNYPTWLQDEKLPNLEDLTMWELINCSSFPPLGQFRRLKSLAIEGINGVKYIGGEFDGDGDQIKGFPSLEVMNMHNMDDLEEWCEPKEGAFPSLQRLVITGCPKLTKMPNNFFTLKHLRIEGCYQLECLPKCPSLVELVLGDSNEILLRWVPHFTSLSILSIRHFDELKSFPKDMLQPLVNLELRIGLPPIPVLRCLCISGCRNIKSLPKGLWSLTSLKDLDIKYCPQLLSMPKEGLPTSLENLRIIDCPKLSLRCREGDGEDWAKISHIPYIRIDGETISFAVVAKMLCCGAWLP